MVRAKFEHAEEIISGSSPPHATITVMDTAATDPGERAFFTGVWMPQAPLAAQRKQGPYRRTTRAKALNLPYVEANPLCKQSLVVTDIDTTEVDDLARIAGMPTPSWTVRKHGPVGTGHIAYALTTPVCLTDAARRRPVNLLARIETGVCDVLGGDTAYSGRIMKNPCAAQENHATLWGEHHLTYSLHDLAQALDTLGALPPWDDPRPRANSGVGRNVDIFDRTRRWAYRAIKRYWADGIDTWSEIVHAHAIAANLNLEKEHRDPLPEKEINQLSRNIAHWVWARFTPEKFSAIQATRGKKSGEKRRGNKRDQTDSIIEINR